MSQTSAIHALPYIQPSQAQKHVTHNEAVRLLDVLAQLSVAGQTDQPPVPDQIGARYIVAPGAIGAWAGQDRTIAVWDGSLWRFHMPQAGWRAWRRDTGALWVFDGTDWGPYADLAEGVPQLGVNATADVANRLAVASDGTLFSHDGAGHQVKVNKAGSAETASLLFQSGWSGRAEMGLAGSDDFALKVSADGATWITALSVAAATGRPDLAAGTTIGGQAAYGRGNLVGVVSESAGQPTGAVIERGSTIDGDYVRFADGTQICTGALDTLVTGSATWTYPAAFAAPPHVTGTLTVDAAQFLTTSGPGTATQTDLSGWAHDGSRVASPARVTAIGRWF